MDFTKLNKAGQLDAFLPTKRLIELEHDKYYQVTDIRKVKTKYGARITVDIDNSFTIFLPARVAKILVNDEDVFKKFVETADENGILIRYLGGPYNQIEFINDM